MQVSREDGDEVGGRCFRMGGGKVFLGTDGQEEGSVAVPSSSDALAQLQVDQWGGCYCITQNLGKIFISNLS